MLKPANSAHPRSHLVAAALSAWLAYVAVDFLLHAALLASWWQTTASFWLPPFELFLRIPFGYGSFLIYCVALTWLLKHVDGHSVSVARWARFGTLAGLVYGTASVLAMYSVVPVPLSAMLVWPGSAAAGSAAAGAAAGWVVGAVRPWRRVGMVVLWMVIAVIVGIVIQNLLGVTTGLDASQTPH